MNDKRKALGRGLEQLFNDEGLNFDTIENSIIEEAKTNDQIVEINLSELRANPYQPRKNFDEEALNELALSIKEHGVFQPIIVKKSIKGYEIIAGERRFRASKLAGMQTIPAIVKDFSDEEMMQIALLENLQRENLTSIEEAKAYKSIIESMNITQDELAKKVGKSRSHITNILGLLKLPASVQDMVLYNKAGYQSLCALGGWAFLLRLGKVVVGHPADTFLGVVVPQEVRNLCPCQAADKAQTEDQIQACVLNRGAKGNGLISLLFGLFLKVGDSCIHVGNLNGQPPGAVFHAGCVGHTVQ